MDVAANNNVTDTLIFLKGMTRLDFVSDDGSQLIRVLGPYGMGDLTPQLEFVIESSVNFIDWDILEAVDTEDGIGEIEFQPQEDIQSRFYRVLVNEIED